MADIMKENGKTFLPRLVPAPEASQFMDAPLIFLAGGLSQYHENLSSLKNSGSLSFSLDKSCLAQECCAVYINSKNRVEIIVNKALADKLRVPFKPIFLMMVTII